MNECNEVNLEFSADSLKKHTHIFINTHTF